MGLSFWCFSVVINSLYINWLLFLKNDVQLKRKIGLGTWHGGWTLAQHMWSHMLNHVGFPLSQRWLTPLIPVVGGDRGSRIARCSRASCATYWMWGQSELQCETLHTHTHTHIHYSACCVEMALFLALLILTLNCSILNEMKLTLC